MGKSPNRDEASQKSDRPRNKGGNDPPLGYIINRFPWNNNHWPGGMIFKIGLNIFYSSVIIENEDFIPRNGEPTIICANHSNSIMDAIVLVTSVSRKVPLHSRTCAERGRIGKCYGVLLRIQSSMEREYQTGSSDKVIPTVRDSGWWLVRPVPIMRQKDHIGEKVDNTAAFQKLIEVHRRKKVLLMVGSGRRGCDYIIPRGNISISFWSGTVKNGCREDYFRCID